MNKNLILFLEEKGFACGDDYFDKETYNQFVKKIDISGFMWGGYADIPMHLNIDVFSEEKNDIGENKIVFGVELFNLNNIEDNIKKIINGTDKIIEFLYKGNYLPKHFADRSNGVLLNKKLLSHYSYNEICIDLSGEEIKITKNKQCYHEI